MRAEARCTPRVAQEPEQVLEQDQAATGLFGIASPAMWMSLR